jgi:hypothetical protein
MYPWIVFLHVAGGFTFVLAHGASASVAFALRRERNPERIRALLDLSSGSFNVMYLSLLVLLAAGIVAGFMQKWWGQGWIWTALGLLIAIMVGMTVFGTLFYGKVRKAAGLQYMESFKPHPPLEPASAAELEALLARGQPVLITVIGFGGLLLILWLMMFKPF